MVGLNNKLCFSNYSPCKHLLNMITQNDVNCTMRVCCLNSTASSFLLQTRQPTLLLGCMSATWRAKTISPSAIPVEEFLPVSTLIVTYLWEFLYSWCTYVWNVWTGLNSTIPFVNKVNHSLMHTHTHTLYRTVPYASHTRLEKRN